MSPEMTLNSGHNRCVDYWAFGILMFELVNGVTPFVGGEVMETYENILEHKSSETLSYKYEISHDFQRLVRGLLKKRPSRRLGSRGGVVDILSSSFLRHSNLRSCEIEVCQHLSYPLVGRMQTMPMKRTVAI